MSSYRAKKTSSARFLRPADTSGRRMAMATTGASIAFLAVLIVTL
jgi:hypothetical protein